MILIYLIITPIFSYYYIYCMYKIIKYENPLLNKNFPMKFLRFLFKRNICEIKEKYKI